MKNNIKIQENSQTQTEVEAKPPQDCDVMLLNSNVVSFETVRDVLSEVLNISTQRAMEIAFQAHRQGRASVFFGPEDVAMQYQRALTEYARSQHSEETEGMGYDLITFQIEKPKS